MAVYNLTFKHFWFQQLSILFSLFMITNFFCALTAFTFASAISFNFPIFNFSDPNILYDKYAHPDENQFIWLTDSTSWLIGRAMYSRPMHLWDKNSKNLTDFTTYFSFGIDSQIQTKYANGLAFFLAPNGPKASIAASAGSLGLCNSASNSISNPFVVVEFDIFIVVRNTEYMYCISQVIEYTWVPFI